MPEPKDFKGKHFNYKLDLGGTMPEGYDGGIKHDSDRTITTHLRNSAGDAHGTPWTFKFLKYWAGAITRTQLNGPLLTGPMSGCILCRYTKGGHTMLAHIGTANAKDSEATVNVKGAWTKYMADGVTNLVGRKPTSVINEHDVFANVLKGPPVVVPKTWGYFTLTDAWALLIRTIHIGGGQTSNEIVMARPMALLPWDQIPDSW